MAVDQSATPLATERDDRAVPRAMRPATPVWLWPGVMIATSLLALWAAWQFPAFRDFWLLVPYTYVGNSLAPLPYDPTIVYLAQQFPLWTVVVLGAAATVIIEFWNMELLARIFCRDGTLGFRAHPVTRWMLRWYRKAPFWTLVATGVLPVIPHYPMRILATLAHYPLWKYQLSVILGRGMRYTWLGGLGVLLKVPAWVLVVASLLFLMVALRGYLKMNRAEEAA